jgi:hypothetical protein
MQTSVFKMSQQIPGVECLRVIIDYQQMRGFDMGTGTDNSAYVGQSPLDIVNLIGRE